MRRRQRIPADERRTERIGVTLTPPEVDRLDAERGETTRSDFLRRLLLERLSRKDAS
jgi:metal-responsive CopG/Arc/MetJ family transcriptional regulator